MLRSPFCTIASCVQYLQIGSLGTYWQSSTLQSVVSAMDTFLPPIKSLYLDALHVYDFEQFWGIQTLFNRLERLKLQKCTFDTDHLRQLLERSSGITMLAIEDSRYVNDLASSDPLCQSQMDCLTLNVNSGTLHVLLPWFQNTRIPSLSLGCGEGTIPAMMYWIQALNSSLTTLKLTHARSIHLDSLASKHSDLERNFM